jgi:hypothetical protein
MNRVLVLLACGLALSATPSLATAREPGGGGAAAEPGSGTATTAQLPRRVRVAYLRWRNRLERHDVYVGRNLLPEVRASDGSARAPTTGELRASIHRMQRRWGRWLRTTERGEAVRFKRKVRHKVPAWGRQYLRNIAACESHGIRMRSAVEGPTGACTSSR